MDEKHICAQDLREKELQEKGFVNLANNRAYIRIGRAMFLVGFESLEKTEEEELVDVINTPLGTVVAVSGNIKKLAEDEEFISLINSLFLPQGFLRIIVEGDPDGGLGLCSSKILLSGYRYGLDDVIVDGKVLQTVHGDHEKMVQDLLYEMEQRISWKTMIFHNHTEEAKKQLRNAKRRLKRNFKSLRETIEIINKYEDEIEDD